MQEISRYNKAALREFIESEEFRKTKMLPISHQRALSYLANPRASDTDPIMYLARIDGKIVAYRLLLPDFVYLGREPVKFAWFSCIYVSPELRGSGIAKKLSAMAMEDWEGKIFYNDPVSASASLYINTGQFTLYPEIAGFKAYLKANFRELIKARRAVPSIIDGSLKLLDNSLNYLNKLRLAGWKKNMAKQVKGYFEYLDKIDEECGQLINKFIPEEFTQRGREELNWIIQHPWILETSNDEYGERYHFSAFEKEFKYFIIKLLDNSNITIGLIIISLRNGQMKVPYCYVKEEAKELLRAVIYHHLLITGASTLTVFNHEVVTCIRSKRHPFWMIRNKTRPLFVASQLLDTMLSSGKHFQDGDGDNVFT